MVEAQTKKKLFHVCEPCDIEIMIRSTQDLLPNDTVEVQFPNSWSLVNGPSFTREFNLTDPTRKHYVNISAIEDDAQFKIEMFKRNLPYSEGKARHGRHIVATLIQGSIPANRNIRILYANTFAPFVAETETIWLRLKGEEPEVVPSLTVVPGPAEQMRIIAPSSSRPGETFNVLIVSLDKFDNCSSTRYDNKVLQTNDGSVAAAGLNFVGCIRVPVSLENEGIYRFTLDDAVSNAVRVEKKLCGPYWGDIHIHTKLSYDAQGSNPYEYTKDVSGLDFAAVTDHWESLGSIGYRQVLKWANDYYVPGEFVTLLGDERSPKEFTGHHNLYFRDEESFLKNIDELVNIQSLNQIDIKDYCVPLDPTVAMIVPHHTGISFEALSNEGIGHTAVDIDSYDDRGMRPVVEIYSHHGQSEVYAPQHILSYEFNRMRKSERRSNTSTQGPYFAQNYWMAGKRLGVVASSDEHSGQGGRRHGGITAVWSKGLSREDIFDAIRNRHCYATTGERILVDFTVDGILMGDCAKRSEGDRLGIRLQIWGTELLLRIEILRYRFGLDHLFTPIFTVSPRPETMDVSYEIEDVLSGNTMYYTRITQNPIDWPGMAWTSPVWIDVE